MKFRLLSRIYLIIILSCCLSLSYSDAKQKDRAFYFAFYENNNMLFLHKNSGKLDSLAKYIKENYDRSLEKIKVTSYGSTIQTSKIMANRVKTDLIVRGLAKESDFITTNFENTDSENKNTVIVSISILKTQKPSDRGESGARNESYSKKTIVNTESSADKDNRSVSSTETETQNYNSLEDVSNALSGRLDDMDISASNGFYLRTNLVHWAVAFPNLGVEWRYRRLGLLLNATYGKYVLKKDYLKHSMYCIQPEVRYYIGRNMRFYTGLFGHFGDYNFKYSEIGHDGNYYGGGLDFGYILPLGKKLSFDFGLGLGADVYSRNDYTREGNISVKQTGGRFFYFGPNHASISLVYKF